MQQRETQEAANATANETDQKGWTGLVEAFAGAVRALESAERRGDLAGLRRLNTDAPDAAAFFRIVVRIAPEAGPTALHRYARFLQILALKPAALASGSFGAAMAAAGVSESRAQKLLTARGSALAKQLRLIARRLANEGTLPYRQIGDLLLIEDEESGRVCESLAVALYSKTAAKDPSSRQALLIGEPEIAYLIDKAKAASGEANAKAATTAIETLFKKEERKNLSAMLAAKGALNAGLEAALFGRMVTSDPNANTNAAVHVGHAFTVHREEAETDYFTVVDDLETGTGAGGIFDTEITAGLFYVYVVVDIPALIANLADDATLAGKVVEHLVHLIATISPGAKKGSTAPYAYADLVLVESGPRQPRSLANAFREACRPTVADATAKLTAHLSRIDAMYGTKETRRVAALDAQIVLPNTSAAVSLDALAEAIAAEVAGG